MTKKAYVAFSENPEVFCAYGASPAETLRNMSRLLKKHEVDIWTAARVEVNYDEPTDKFFMVIYS